MQDTDSESPAQSHIKSLKGGISDHLATLRVPSKHEIANSHAKLQANVTRTLWHQRLSSKTTKLSEFICTTGTSGCQNIELVPAQCDIWVDYMFGLRHMG